ncbi:hypothetical protein WJT86_06395 [Microvirga sp. W0021]|uniref:Uncharacterized protein n=1 Tax=Hohaiivirga grylli TaxID=3133970 RepID=A0ABV0BIA9_9HYPH
MAIERKRPPKGETLTIRLDTKNRFMLDFMARLKGQTITMVIERALADAAERTVIHKKSPFSRNDYSENWKDYWDVNEGIRSLKIYQENELFPTYEEEKRLQFTKIHHVFFYKDNTFSIFIPHYIEILWPRIDEFIKLWDETKSKDYFEAGMEMLRAISEAGLRPPTWPPQTTQSQETKSRFNDLDDDLPF